MLRFGVTAAALGVAVATAGAPAYGETLQDALALAYQSNPDLVGERARVRGLDEQYYVARSSYLPSVSGSASVSGSDAENITDLNRFGGGGTAADSDTTGTYDFGISATQNIYRGGRTGAAIDEAKAQISSGRASLLSTEQTVLLNAVSAYMNVRRDEEVVSIRLNNVSVLARQLEESRDRFEVGEITRTDVAQAEARLAGANAELAAARATLTASRANYETVVGQQPGTLDEEPPLPTLPTSFDEALAAAINDNPDISSARYGELQARASRRGARGAFLPSISLSASAARSDGFTTGTGESQSVSAQATLSVPLFTGGLNSAQLRAAREEEQRARMNTYAAERRVREGVASAWSSYESALSQIESTSEAARANEVALEGVQEEARVGLRTTLDVLNAEQELLNARLSLATAERDAYIAAFALLQAVGGLTAEALGLSVELYDPSQNLNVDLP